jgi:hypothetical protein
MKLKRFIRRKFRRLAFRPDYVRDESLPSFNSAKYLSAQAMPGQKDGVI